MNILRMMKTTALPLAITGAVLSSCSQPPQNVEKVEITAELKSKLDSISDESKKVLSDSNYVCYGRDLIHVSPELITKEPQKGVLQSALNESAALNMDSINVDKIEVYNAYKKGLAPGKNYRIYHDAIYYINAPAYLSPKAVIENKDSITTDGRYVVIPVKYYGIYNSDKILDAKTSELKRSLDNLPRLRTDY